MKYECLGFVDETKFASIPPEKAQRMMEECLVVPVWRDREKLDYLNPVPIDNIADRWISKFEQCRLRAIADLSLALSVGTRGRRCALRLAETQGPSATRERASELR